MAESNQHRQEFIPFLEDSPNDEFSFLPKDQNDTFLNKENDFKQFENMNSPKNGDLAPSSFFSTLVDEADKEFSEFFYILNPMTGVLEESLDKMPLNNEENENQYNYEENLDVVPAKKLKRELTVYEETLLKNFNAEIDKEQKLLAAEHEKKMQLWDLEMQSSQQQHALKMAILKEKLEKIQQEKKNIELPQNLKYLSKFKSGPI